MAKRTCFRKLATKIARQQNEQNTSGDLCAIKRLLARCVTIHPEVRVWGSLLALSVTPTQGKASVMKFDPRPRHFCVDGVEANI